MLGINLKRAARENPIAVAVLIIFVLFISGYFVYNYIAGGASGKAIAGVGVCGDGQRQQPNSLGFNEQCDGGEQSCDATVNDKLGYKGKQICKSDCTFETCKTNERCRDGTRNGHEQCDGTVPSGITCQALGFKSGSLTCSLTTCTFDTSNCVS